jgi:TPR repeat protein
MLLLEGRVVPYDPALAFRYAYRSALASHLSAADLVARMFREGIGTSADPARARAWEAEAETLRAEATPAPPAAAPPRPAPPSFARRAVRRLRRAAGGGTGSDRRGPVDPQRGLRA